MNNNKRKPKFGDMVELYIHNKQMDRAMPVQLKVLDFQTKENTTAFTSEALYYGEKEMMTLSEEKEVLTVYDGNKIFDIFYDEQDCYNLMSGDRAVFQAMENEMDDIVKYLPTTYIVHELMHDVAVIQSEIMEKVDINGDVKSGLWSFSDAIAKLKVIQRVMADKFYNDYSHEDCRPEWIVDEIDEIKRNIGHYAEAAQREYSWQMLKLLQKELKEAEACLFVFGNKIIDGNYTGDYNGCKICVNRKITPHMTTPCANIKIDKNLIYIYPLLGNVEYGFIEDMKAIWSKDDIIQSVYTLEYDSYYKKFPIEKVLEILTKIKKLEEDYETWKKERPKNW